VKNIEKKMHIGKGTGLFFHGFAEKTGKKVRKIKKKSPIFP